MIVHLYMDEDSMDAHLVRALRARHVDVVTSEEAGMRERTDEEQLAYATAQGRVIYSFNVGHFSQLHADYLSKRQRHTGIVLAPQQRYSVGEQMRRLLRLIGMRSAEDMKNQVEFLNSWG